MHYYKFNISDWVLHTNHLSLEEEAVYRRLLDHYYETESPIPLKTESVIRRLRLVSYADIASSMIEEFFVKQDDGWHNLRADVEILEYKKKGDTARKNGKNGGRPKKNSASKTKPVIDRNPEESGSKANYKLRTNNYKLETKEEKPPQSPKGKKSAIELKTYLDQQKKLGEKAIPENDPVYTRAQESGIPPEFLHLAWEVFKQRMFDSKKKYKDWRQTFRNYVFNDYLKLWAINRDGEYYLTTIGKQQNNIYQKVRV